MSNTIKGTCVFVLPEHWTEDEDGSRKFFGDISFTDYGDEIPTYDKNGDRYLAHSYRISIRPEILEFISIDKEKFPTKEQVYIEVAKRVEEFMKTFKIELEKFNG